MFYTIVFLLIGLFAALLFLNVYFRVKVFKVYRKLIENRVEFGAKHIFSASKMQNEVLPRFPQMRDDILLFVGHIKYSIGIAILLLVLITFLGLILMHYN